MMVKPTTMVKVTFYIERYQRFIFDEEHELSRKQIQRHWHIPQSHFADPCSRYGVKTAN